MTVVQRSHIAMRVQNLKQMIRGRPARCDGPSNATMINVLQGAKWHLWHGCPYPVLRRLESLGWDLDPEASAEEAKLLSKLEEFIVYLDNNRSCIVNYDDRYRHGEPITSGFAELAVNQVVSKRFVKRQQMAWRPRPKTSYKSGRPCSISGSGRTLNCTVSCGFACD